MLDYRQKSITHHPSEEKLCLSANISHLRRSGISLIELLAVIAIIGTLASISFIYFRNDLEKAQDKRRKSDVISLKQALISAKQDDGVYKNTLTDLSPKYISKIPKDPKLAIDYAYIPQPTTPDCTLTSLCTSFDLIACLNNPNDKEQDSSKNPGCPIASYTATPPQ